MEDVYEFWYAVDRTCRPSNCWPWMQGRHPGGYGVLRWRGEVRKATHVALELSGLPRPTPKHQAMHSCDNPICCNPAHLHWGTAKENNDDKIVKRRDLGTAPGHRRLTPEQVEEIRTRLAAGERGQALAQEFGVSGGTISLLRSGKAHGDNAPERAHGNAKLTSEQVEEIRGALAAGESGKSLARRYSVTPMTISNIRNGKAHQRSSPST